MYISVTGSVALILNSDAGSFTVSNPSQTLTNVSVIAEVINKVPPLVCFGNFDLPPGPGGLAGSSVTIPCFPVPPFQHVV